MEMEMEMDLPFPVMTFPYGKYGSLLVKCMLIDTNFFLISWAFLLTMKNLLWDHTKQRNLSMIDNVIALDKQKILFKPSASDIRCRSGKNNRAIHLHLGAGQQQTDRRFRVISTSVAS